MADRKKEIGGRQFEEVVYAMQRKTACLTARFIYTMYAKENEERRK